MNTEVRPVPGELMSCWLYRQSLISENTSLDRESLAALWRVSTQAGDVDPDYSRLSYFSNTACETLNVDVELKSILLDPPSGWLIPRFYRRSYCYECLVESTRKFSVPTTLKEWCAVGYVVCETHNSPLIDAVDIFGPKPSMAMKFLQMHVSNRHRYIAASRAELASKSIRSLVKLQGIVRNLEKSSQDCERNLDASNKCEWRFAKFILSLMLFPRFGVVSRWARNDADVRFPVFHQDFISGPLTASVGNRMAALLIFSWLSDLIDPNESSDVDRVVNEIGEVCGFADAYGLGYSANGFTLERGSFIARRLAQWQPAITSTKILEFIAGFLASTRK